MIREFKARYHEMANRIAFLEERLEECKPLVVQLAAGDLKKVDCSYAISLLHNWPGTKQQSAGISVGPTDPYHSLLE